MGQFCFPERNMTDVHDKATRSKNMSAIRNKNTRPEQLVARLLDDLELTYTTHDKSLPGTPDFVLSEYQALIFVHGCYWHKHKCHLFKVPSTRTEFWLGKIGENVARDKKNETLLHQANWKILYIWECALKGKQKQSLPALSEYIEEWLFAIQKTAELSSRGISVK